MKKILVTGSGGFIFSNFIRKCLFDKLPYKFVSVDYCKVPNVLNNIYANKGHTFYVANVADRHAMDVIFQIEQPDYVIHAAAESFVDASIQDASAFITSNVLGTQVIVDLCLKWKVQKLLYVSTDEVYGHLTSELQTSWTEMSNLNPRNPYSASKAAGELLVQAAHHTHGLPYLITRSCNNFGPRQQSRNFIPKIIKSILENTPMPIFGQGMQMREWIYVEDNCEATLTVLEKGQLNSIYNISTGYELSNIEMFQKICNIMGTGHNLAKFVTDRPGHDFRYSINPSLIKDLGWKPKYKLQEGLYKCIEWYKNNNWFIK